MKHFVILFIILYVPVRGLSQDVHIRNIMTKAYTEERLAEITIPGKAWKPYPQTPEEWAEALPQPVIQSFIKRAEKFREYRFEPLPATVLMDFKRTGDRQRHQSLSFDKRTKLMLLAVAESMEGKGRFTEAVFNGVWSVCEESYWGVPAHIPGTGLPDVENPVVDLFAAETAAVMAFADYFVGAQLDTINPLIRKRIYHETNTRMFKPMLENPQRHGWMSKTRPVNNWNPWIMSNWMISALLLEKNEGRRVKMLYQALDGLDSYLNSLGDDGGCDEGPSYWFAAGACVFDCLEMLDLATTGEVALYRNELIRKMAGYVYKMHISENYFVNFADADPTLNIDAFLLQRIAKNIQDEGMLSFARWAAEKQPVPAFTRFHWSRRLQNMLDAAHPLAEAPSYKPAEMSWFEDIEVMTARSEKGLFFASHGGHNAESHNHNDVGDFILYKNGQPMIIDAGRGNYTSRTFSSQRYSLWFTQSGYHNLPIINEVEQKEGRKFQSAGARTAFSEKAAIFSLDIAGAYPAKAQVVSWERLYELRRKTDELQIKDNFSFKAGNNRISQVFMIVGEADLTQKGKIRIQNNGEQLEIQYDPKFWTPAMDQPSTEGMEYSSFKTKWEGKTVQRIILSSVNVGKAGQITFLLK